jgi:release factor glutamine methyltransferase
MNKLITHITQTTHLNHSEAIWLIEHMCKRSQASLAVQPLTPQELRRIRSLVYRIRISKKPLAYVLKTVPFLNLTIQVKPPVLIPRPETEEWVCKIIQTFAPNSVRTILEIGTGSGCISLALAAHFAQAHVIAIDINKKALNLAKKNSKLNDIKNIEFVHSNLFANIKNQKFDLIVSNPPYIDPAKKETLAPAVLQWEDHQALFAPKHGMQMIESIIAQSKNYLNPLPELPAQLIIEIDQDQKNAALTFAKQHNFLGNGHKDLFNQWRTIWLQFNKL